MTDLDPSKAESFGALVKCLKQLHIRADEPTCRALDQQTVHISGLLPGTRLKRVRLNRTTLSDVLSGRRFPTKAFLLTFVEACGIDLENDSRWEQAWNRLADQAKQAVPAAEEAERLRLEIEELRQRLAEAEHRAEAAFGRSHDVVDQHVAAAGEQAAAGRQDAFDPEVIRRWLDVTPTPTMRSLTELRLAIEPPAASLAARRIQADVCRELVLLGWQLQELGENSQFSEDNPVGRRIRGNYQDVDARFHEALLKGSQNEMFYALKDPVKQALSYRIHREWAGERGPGSGAGGTKRFPPRPAPLSLWLHRALAAAVAQGQSGAAEMLARAILTEIGTEPLSAADAVALEQALELLDPGVADGGPGGVGPGGVGPGGVGRVGWERLRYAIKAAVLSAAASAALLGPVVVMGVAGCGKTTAGQLLSGSLGIPYAEADSFHPPANVARMAAGTPLTDQDRGPWLEAIADRIRLGSRVVVSCSALKRSYRDVLRQADPRAWFLHLAIDRETAAARVARRTAHFMPASLVDSQFADLEPLHREEAGLTVDGSLPHEQILAAAMEALAVAGERGGG